MAQESVGIWELAGIPVIFLVGSVLHFVFELSGYRRLVAWLSPVNESVWEHFKLAFWPAVLYAGLEYAFIGEAAGNFWLGKSLGVFCMPLVMGAAYYGYTAVVGNRYLWADILSFLVAVIAGQLISWFVLAAPGAGLERPSLLGMAAMMAVFVVCSYAPPRIVLFKDFYKEEYGILQHYDRPVFASRRKSPPPPPDTSEN